MKRRTIILIAGGALIARRIRQNGWRLVEHDLIDHPLMTLIPALGDRLHDRHTPDPEYRTVATICDELREMVTRREILLPYDDTSIIDELEEFLAPSRRCYVCGCTDTIACQDICSWSHRDNMGNFICSSCVKPGTTGEHVFGNPPSPEHLALSVGQRVAIEQTLRIKAHRSNGVPLPPGLR